MRNLGLERYAAIFRENDVDARLLPNLTADDLKDLGITSVGHRRQLLEAIAALRSNDAPPRPPATLHANLHRTRGEILLKRRARNEAAAEADLNRAIAIARSQSAKLFELQAAVSLGRLWLAHGKHAHAREVVAPICAWFDAGPDCEALSEARVLLRDVGAM